ncbi:MAG: hypothetical protein L6R40_002692 [Gallowayella cf. fulva]|nr:MAG: hypothetical protein L6R40_002692 [Xanthomendoza cf. fulva]
MFLLSWTTPARYEKEPFDKATSPSTLWPRSSATEASLLNRMKRKRGNSDELGVLPSPVKPHTEQLSHINIPSPVNASSFTPGPTQSNARVSDTTNNPNRLEDQTDRMDWQQAHNERPPARPQIPELGSASPSTPSASRHGRDAIVKAPSLHTPRDTIEAQFSLEILLKHRELRLIEQEIAKCQVALEQLRRCHVIPYPAMSSSEEEMQAVASGRGPIQNFEAEAAPPWGITNGPYTRHYRHWLIPDATFGDGVTQEMPGLLPSRLYSDRSVRASTAGKSSLVHTSRSQRGQGSARLKALPHGYPEAKEDKGPMIVKRSTDGHMVKLICLDCRRGDFNSVQGFINHCRIAHSRNFQSHDAAAIACGEEVELDQAGGIKGESSTADVSGAGLVHPLIRSTHGAPSPLVFSKRESSTAMDKTPSRSPAAVFVDHDESVSAQTPASETSGCAPAPFRPSPQTPHLSALFAKNGRGGDLESEVRLATTKFQDDFNMYSDDDADEDDGEEKDVEATQSPSGPASHSTRGIVAPDYRPSRAVMAPAQLASSPSVEPSKAGSQMLNDHPTSLQLRGAGVHNGGNLSLADEARNHDGESSPNLSHNTVEAHQAPSLISDDDEFENTHSECSSSADVAEDLERHYFGMDFAGHDEQAMEDLERTGSSASASHLGLDAEMKSSHPPRRSSAMRPPDTIRNPTSNSERRVSFASPIPRARKKGGK